MKNKYFIAISGIFLALFIYYSGEIAFAFIPDWKPGFYDRHFVMLDAFMAAVLSLVFLALFYMYKFTNTNSPKLKFRPIDFGFYLIITFGINGMSFLILNYLSDFVTSDIITDSFESFDSSMAVYYDETYLATLLSVVIFGPIMEELLFRGLIFNFAKKIKDGWFPIILSALLFGLWHAEPVQSIYTFAIGLVLGFIYAHTRSLYFSIYVHMINNLLSSLPSCLNTDPINIGINITSLICLAIMPFLLYFTKKRSSQELSQNLIN